jgi:Kef-type K+ transport system membrane component KefB
MSASAESTAGGESSLIAVGREFFLLALILGVTTLVIDLGAADEGSVPMAGSGLAFGFLLLFGFLCGRLANRFDAPMLTGFLIAGAIAGPHIMNIVTDSRAEPLRLVDDLALALIALAAGGELKLARLKGRAWSILITAAVQVGTIFIIVFAALTPTLAFTSLGEQGGSMVLAAAFLLAVVATANSPSSVIAVITEIRASGVVADTILSVTIVKDVIVIVAFGFAVAIGDMIVTGASASGYSFLGKMALEVSLSLAVGTVIGIAVIRYLRATEENVPLFLLGVSLIVVELSDAFHLSLLLTAIAVGFVVENYSQKGERLIDGLRTGSLPVFVIFFALAGQHIDFSALASMWPVATVLALARMAAVRIGTAQGLTLAGEDPLIATFAWTGFIGQAGVALGFAAILSIKFPGMGETLATLIVAVVAINELVGPILMKKSLEKAGEAGRERMTSDSKPAVSE